MHSFFSNARQTALLIKRMTLRGIAERYRGSIFGMAWALLTPIMMLAVYTFIFTQVFPVKWGQDVSKMGTFQFSILLFIGLSLYQFFSEVLLDAGPLMANNANYVKKVVFPLQALSIISVNKALFQLLVALLVIIIFQLIWGSGLPATVILSPLILLPFVFLALGLSWFFAGVGTYLRDVNQVLAPITTALLFLGPILYPLDTMPEHIRPYLYLNPVTFPVEELRTVLIWGQLPSWNGLAIYSLIACLICLLGRLWFDKVKKGFADVL